MYFAIITHANLMTFSISFIVSMTIVIVSLGASLEVSSSTLQDLQSLSL
jgi:hypothetical protein